MHIVQVFGNEDVSAFTIIEAQVPVKAIRKVPVAISPENLTPGTERPLTCDEIGLCKLKLGTLDTPHVCALRLWVLRPEYRTSSKALHTKKSKISSGSKCLSKATTLRINSKLPVSQIKNLI